ncbi:hypothetical protein D3C84_1176130 [compost metagenome]
MLNNPSELASSAPSPSIAAADRQNRPLALPSEDHIALRWPWARLLLIAINVAGPGLAMAIAATRVKASIVFGSMVPGS